MFWLISPNQENTAAWTPKINVKTLKRLTSLNEEAKKAMNVQFIFWAQKIYSVGSIVKIY